MFSVIHEAGHAIYEQNIDPAYAYTCLGTGSTMGIHESQSRFFENIVGRSRAFMGPLLAVLRKHVPEAYGSVSEDQLYRAANIALPQLIRTEADELTYPLHIMVRYDIERMLFAGEATARDIPELWAYGAQMVPAMAADGVDVDAACAAGDLAPVRTWLREKIWRWGAGKDAPELILNACGAPFDATFYCDYLQKKFSELYGL